MVQTEASLFVKYSVPGTGSCCHMHKFPVLLKLGGAGRGRVVWRGRSKPETTVDVWGDEEEPFQNLDFCDWDGSCVGFVEWNGMI